MKNRFSSLLLLFFAAPALAGTQGRSYLELIEVTDDRYEAEAAYESIHSETVIPKSVITQGNTRDISEVLQKVPGVSVSGGSEAQNKKVSIRGLDGFRVIQQVDGAQRQESTQEGLTSGLFIEPEMLSQISVQNGADSVGSINGAMGGTIQYKTISPKDILSGKRTSAVKLKMATDSATEGQARSIHAAARVDKASAVLVGVTSRESHRIESGSDGGADAKRLTEKTDSKRSTYLGKYIRKAGRAQTSAKVEYADSMNKNASYLSGGEEDNSDYQTSTLEVVLGHEQNVSTVLKYDINSYYNKTISLKDTHTAYRDIESTVGRVEDRLENAGVQLSATSILSLSADVQLQSKNGLEGFGMKISEEDGTGSAYFGESQGFDAGVFSENALSTNQDRVHFMVGGRYTHYTRESKKLALQSPGKNDDTVSGMVGMSYAPVAWFKISGKYGISNRAPNVREMYYGTGKPWRCHRPAKECTSAPNPVLAEERAFSKEVSILLKNPEAEPARHLKVTYFNDSINDYIEYMPQMYRVENGARIVAGPTTATHREYQYRNLSTVIRHGLEAQARAEQGNWSWEAMYSMVRMECRDCPDMFTATTLTEPLVSAPADKFGLAAGYEFTSVNVRLGADAQFVSAQNNLSQRYLLAGYGTPAYDVYGLNMRWTPRMQDGGQWEVALGVSNLFDRMYVVHNSPRGTFELGRNYSLSIAAIF